MMNDQQNSRSSKMEKISEPRLQGSSSSGLPKAQNVKTDNVVTLGNKFIPTGSKRTKVRSIKDMIKFYTIESSDLSITIYYNKQIPGGFNEYFGG